MSLNVLYAAETGHVLGAVAVSGPVTTPSVEDLAGPALPLWVADRTAAVDLAVPAARLAVVTVADEEGALAAPCDFGVDVSPGQAPRSALRRLDPWPEGFMPFEPVPAGVEITVPRSRPEATAVLVVIAGPTSPPPVLSEIPAGDQDVIVGATLTSGEYGILVLAAGWAGRLERLTIQ
jgi:hypothetical protein